MKADLVSKTFLLLPGFSPIVRRGIGRNDESRERTRCSQERYLITCYQRAFSLCACGLDAAAVVAVVAVAAAVVVVAVAVAAVVAGGPPLVLPVPSDPEPEPEVPAVAEPETLPQCEVPSVPEIPAVSGALTVAAVVPKWQTSFGFIHPSFWDGFAHYGCMSSLVHCIKVIIIIMLP